MRELPSVPLFSRDGSAFQGNEASIGVQGLRLGAQSFFQGIGDVPPFLLDEQLIFSGQPSDGLKD